MLKVSSKNITIQKIDRVSSSYQIGFTLIEVLVTMVIMVILLLVAVPSFKSALQIQTTASEINNLLNDLQFVRSEAIKEGQYVSICVSSTGTSCTVSTWDSGWIIYSNPSYTTSPNYVAGTSTLLRSQAKLTSGDIISASAGTAVITYNQDGFAMNISNTLGQLLTVRTSSINASATRCIWIDVLGRQYLQLPGSAAISGQGTNLCIA